MLGEKYIHKSQRQEKKLFSSNCTQNISLLMEFFTFKYTHFV